jgi:hypothetical protein
MFASLMPTTASTAQPISKRTKLKKLLDSQDFETALEFVRYELWILLECSTISLNTICDDSNRESIQPKDLSYPGISSDRLQACKFYVPSLASSFCSKTKCNNLSG